MQNQPGDGRGLFIRLIPGAEPVVLPGGTALCGYSPGEMCTAPPPKASERHLERNLRDRTIPFRMTGCADVWFEDELVSACTLLQRDDIAEIAGHAAVLDGAGDLLSIRAEASTQFFVPDEAAASALLDVTCVGIMANDLAGGDRVESARDYEIASADSNVLIFVQELKRVPEAHSRLVPSRPVVTLARPIVLANREPMELGISYGAGYWM